MSGKVNVLLTAKEARLIDVIRKIPFGQVTVIMHDSEPQRIERAVEKVQL